MASISYNKIVAVPSSGNKNPAAPKAEDKLNLSLVESSIQIGVGGFFKVLDSAGASLVRAENTAFTVAQAATFSSTLGAGASTLASAIVSGTLSAGASTLDSATVTNNLTVSGNLTVNGTTTSLHAENTQIKDNIIVLNDGEVAAGVTAGTSGISIDRGSADDAAILWDEATDKFNLKVGVDFADLKIKDLSAVGATLTGNLAAVDATLSGAVSFTKSADTLSIALPSMAITETYALNVDGGAHFDGHARFARASGSNDLSGGTFTPDFMVSGKALYFASAGTYANPDLLVRGYSKFSAGFAVAAEAAASIAITGVADDAISFSTITDGHIHLDSANILKLSAYIGIATNHTAIANVEVGPYLALSINAQGKFVAISAVAKNALVLGVSLATIGASASSKGKVAEFGKVRIAVADGVSIAAGDMLYLSANQAGKVTNEIPTGADSTAYMMGVALEAPAEGAVSMAMHRQFLYNN